MLGKLKTIISKKKSKVITYEIFWFCTIWSQNLRNLHQIELQTVGYGSYAISFFIPKNSHNLLYVWIQKNQFWFQLSYVTTTQNACTVWQSLKRYAVTYVIGVFKVQ